jgi:hypothetical protein
MKRKARLESQLKLNKIMAVSVAIYGSETYIVRKNCETRIQTAEMKFLSGVARYLHTEQIQKS